MRSPLLFGLFLTFAGCSVPPPAEHGGLALDATWARFMTSPPPASPELFASWLQNNPRWAGSVTSPSVTMATTSLLTTVSNPALFTVDWQYPVSQQASQPLSVSPAVYIANGVSANNQLDRVFGTGGDGAGNNYIGVGNNIYGANPSILWPSAQFPNGIIDSWIDGVAINLKNDGSVLYEVSSRGTVYAVRGSDGSALAGWPVTLGAAVSWSTPWLDEPSNLLYVGDLNGRVTAFNATTGAQKWQKAVCNKIHSSLTVWSNVVYALCDDGGMRRLAVTNGALFGNTSFCVGTCAATDALWSAPTIDTLANRMIFGASNRLVQINLALCTNQAICGGITIVPLTTSASSVTSTAAIHYSTPAIDTTSALAFAAFNNRVWRLAYPLTSGAVATATAAGALGNNANLGYPKSGPTPFGGKVYVGDGAGYINRINPSTMAIERRTQYGATIDATPLVDFVNGNIYYSTNGVMNGGTPDTTQGSWVQLPQNW